MLQIKTIKHYDPEYFDDKVNEALNDGWTLTRRLSGPDVCIAELEKESITEDDKTCENCKHFDKKEIEEPCFSCKTGELWEAGV